MIGITIAGGRAEALDQAAEHSGPELARQGISPGQLELNRLAPLAGRGRARPHWRGRMSPNCDRILLSGWGAYYPHWRG